jgi:hypothetical protein
LPSARWTPNIRSVRSRIDDRRNAGIGDVAHPVDAIARGAVASSVAALDADPHVIFALSHELDLVYFNAAYLEFAAQNGGDPGALTLGPTFLPAMTPAVQRHHEAQLLGALRTGTPWHLDYACPGGGKYREFHQIAYPSRYRDGLIVVNSLKIEVPMSSQAGARPPVEDAYRQRNGLITQCSNCRRTQRADGTAVWDWIPDWVDDMPPDTSHSICETCFGHYWK